MDTARQLRCLYDLAFAELDLNLSQASLLAYVGDFGANTQTTLAERMGLGRAATGTMIDQLEHRGLLERLPDPEDRRVWLIGLTDKGRALVERITSIDVVVRDDLRVGISRQDRQHLATVLVRLQENIAGGQARITCGPDGQRPTSSTSNQRTPQADP